MKSDRNGRHHYLKSLSVNIDWGPTWEIANSIHQRPICHMCHLATAIDQRNTAAHCDAEERQNLAYRCRGSSRVVVVSTISLYWLIISWIIVLIAHY